ncbi:MAG: biopolymer transporter ExbD [Candidatus Methylacidiphilales bacterium]
MNFRKYVSTEPMSLQLAPFIDVMMFLLTFFLLTWSLGRYEAELSIRLPTAEEAEVSRAMPGEILINVNREGQVLINRRLHSPEQLRTLLTRLTEDFPDQAVILRADAEASYQDVIRVIDVCKAANVWNIAFVTAVPGEPALQPEP